MFRTRPSGTQADGITLNDLANGLEIDDNQRVIAHGDLSIKTLTNTPFIGTNANGTIIATGDYNDLSNKPNIPPEFNLDEGSYQNDIIHWAEIGSVQAISTDQIGNASSGNSWTGIPAQGGSGSGLVCNIIRRRYTGIHEVYINQAGEDYVAGDTVSFNIGATLVCTIDKVNETVDGWVARPGSDYFVSNKQDSLNTGRPQFMFGGAFGGKPTDTLRGEVACTFFPIGDKSNLIIDHIAERTNHHYYMSGNNTHSSQRYYMLLDDGVTYERKLWHEAYPAEAVPYFDWGFDLDPGDGSDPVPTSVFSIKSDRINVNEGNIPNYYFHVDTANEFPFGICEKNRPQRAILINPTTGRISYNRINIALSFHAAAGKYNFKNDVDDANTGEINAGDINCGKVIATKLVIDADDLVNILIKNDVEITDSAYCLHTYEFKGITGAQFRVVRGAGTDASQSYADFRLGGVEMDDRVVRYDSDLSTHFFGNVTSSGTIGFSGRFNVHMEADDPAAYQTVYSTNENGEQVEEQQYTGTTEDLLSIIKDLRDRIAALEAG